MESLLKVFADTLTELMEDSHMGVRQLSEMINCDKAAIRRWLYNLYLPDPEIIIKISDTFNVSADYLFGLSENKEFTKVESSDTFYQRYVKLRNTNKYNDSKVSKECNIRDSILSKWKNIKKFPSTESLLKLCTHFHCSLDYLLGRARD